jgi:hypothetical protein
VPHDRIDYASATGNSWKEQTLLNIVKLRYADMPIFLDVAQVIAGYQLQSAIGGSFSAGNFTAGIVGPFTAVGSANAAGTYTDRPTVIYSPLTGVDFLKRLMTPVPPSSVLFMLQSGYSALRVLVADAQPQDAYVATQYDGRWFWIANTDIQSKYTFGIIMLLFSIADTGVKGLAPVVTIPAQ